VYDVIFNCAFNGIAIDDHDYLMLLHYRKEAELFLQMSAEDEQLDYLQLSSINNLLDIIGSPRIKHGKTFSGDLRKTTQMSITTDQEKLEIGDESEALSEGTFAEIVPAEETLREALRLINKKGACKGVGDFFFPERGESTREQKEICRGCAVRFQCLEYAIENKEKFGIWGGMSERERRRLRRQRNIAAKNEIGA
jgi:WhiB family redox-sensing transcriptional regulator